MQDEPDRTWDADQLDLLMATHLDEVMGCASIHRWAWDLGNDQLAWSPPESSEHDWATTIAAGSLDAFLEVAISEDRNALEVALVAARSSRTEIHHTFRYVGDDGSVGTVTLDAAPVQNATGHAFFVGIMRDDTAQALVVDRLIESFEVRDRVARALEISLLPPVLPTVPGSTTDADYRSTEGISTGDFYDLFPLGGQDWGFTIGDVGGHGTDAAAVTTAIRYTLRAAAQVRKSPVKVMSAGNDAHFAAVLDERFTTAHYVRITAAKSGFQARVATAGHPALFVRRAAGAIEAFAGQGPMLGLMQPADFVMSRTSLGPGDMLVACTDGVLEARNGNALFGRSGIEAFLRAWRGPVAGCAAALHDAAEAFNGGAVGDDMATVVLRVDDDSVVGL